MKITSVGIDLAKNVFQIHGVDERGKAVLKKQLKRSQVAAFFGLPGVLSIFGARSRDTSRSELILLLEATPAEGGSEAGT